MRLPKRWQWLAYVLAPALLVIVVAVQRYNVYVHDQTPWAGGGFGMFSTVDVPGARLLRAYVVTDRGPALAVEPRLGADDLLVYTQPTAARVEATAQYLAAQDWRVYDASMYEELWSVLPQDFRRYLLRSPTWRAARADSASFEDVYPPRIAFDARRPLGIGLPIDAQALEARVEIWKPVFDHDRNELTYTLIRRASAPVVTP